MNQKALESLALYWKEHRFRFGDRIIDWGKHFKDVYFIKEGEVKLLRQKKADEDEAEQVTRILEGKKKPFEKHPLINSALFKVNDYVEIGIRTAKQTFGEEYMYLKRPSDYRVVVSSEHVVVVTIPFANVEATFRQLEMFKHGKCGILTEA